MNVFIALLIALFSLSACSGSDVRNTLGLERNQPDEFKVVAKPPLTLPPDYHLRPPSNTRPDIKSSGARAAKILYGEDGGAHSHPADAESHLLRKAGAQDAENNIREKIRQDAAAENNDDAKRSWLGSLSRGAQEVQDEVIDAHEERKQILQQRKGQLSDGEASLLDRICLLYTSPSPRDA